MSDSISIKDRISNDIKTAMKSQDKVRLNVLRMILSDIKYLEVELRANDNSKPDELIKAVEGYAKKLQKALDETPDSPMKTAMIGEMAIVKEYLPQKADAQETTNAIVEVLAGTAERNFGLVMKAVVAKLGSKADNRLVSQLLKDKLE